MGLAGSVRGMGWCRGGMGRGRMEEGEGWGKGWRRERMEGRKGGREKRWRGKGDGRVGEERC